MIERFTQMCLFFSCVNMMCVCIIVSDQQRHEELVQVDDLDASQAHFDLSVHLWHVAITISLCCPRKQRQFKVEQLLTNDGYGLQVSKKQGTWSAGWNIKTCIILQTTFISSTLTRQISYSPTTPTVIMYSVKSSWWLLTFVLHVCVCNT